MSRLEIIAKNRISTERRTADEYNEITKVCGGKHCAICDALAKLGNTVYYLTAHGAYNRFGENLIDDIEDENDANKKYGITNTWNETEVRERKVKNRVVISGKARGVFVCDAHSKSNLRHYLENYTTENNYCSGKEKPCKDGITTSFELETSDLSDKAAVELIVNHYAIPTSDCTVYVEIKPPIFYNLSGCTKLLGKIESLQESGDIEINRTCGTHLHTGTQSGEIDFRELFGTRANIKNYIAFFEPLALHISRDYTDEEREELFGRTYTEWSRRVYFGDDFCKCGNTVYGRDYYGMKDCHEAMFNVQHSYSIEWRLPKYRNAEQYRKCIIAMQAVMIVLKKAYEENGGENISVDALRRAGNEAREAFKKVFKR